MVVAYVDQLSNGSHTTLTQKQYHIINNQASGITI